MPRWNALDFTLILVFAWVFPLLADGVGKLPTPAPASPPAVCVRLSWDFSSCSYGDLLSNVERILTTLKESSKECPHNAITELNLQFGVDTQKEAKTKIQDLCSKLQVEQFPWESVTNRGPSFDDEYFAGHGPWNLQVETEHYGSRMFHLKDDASRVNSIYRSFAQLSSFTWPKKVDSLANCKLRAVTCCMTGDRQANDNNGNCATPYDTNCINAKPADNTQVCVNGSIPPIPQMQEPVHCHGFAWSNNDLDDSYLFRGNKLFYTSLYDHFYQRGYVKNLPGAPMCGCVEKMPVVSRADCTQVDVDWSFRFTPSKEGASITLENVEVDFRACQGQESHSNDLLDYYNRLVVEGKATVEEFLQLRKFVLPHNASNCSDGFVDSQDDGTREALDSEYSSLVRDAILISRDDVRDGDFFVDESSVRSLLEKYLPRWGLVAGAWSPTVWNRWASGRYIRVSQLPEFMKDLGSSRRLLVV